MIVKSAAMRTFTWISATALVASVGSVVLGPAAPASASCSHSHPDVSSHNDYLQVTGDNVTMRKGPHRTCDPVETFDKGTYMYPFCYTTGDTVTRGGATYSTWSYVRLAALGEPEGWISDAYLTNAGADVHC